MNIPATHLATGQTGWVQAVKKEPGRANQYYFQDDRTQPGPWAHGWMHSSQLAIPGVNA